MAWDGHLQVLIYGDFQPPTADIEYPDLGIVLEKEPQSGTVIRGVKTVLRAKVSVHERTIPALLDAARRVNLLLGAYTLHQWGNSAIGWWSWVTHDAGGGMVSTLGGDVTGTIAAARKLPEQVGRKVEAAMFWVREPHRSTFEFHRSSVLRTYSAYWNAFECLVEAICLLKPDDARLSKIEKQSRVDDHLRTTGGAMVIGDLQRLYHEVVNPGLLGKASHALKVCFGEEQGSSYTEECFRLKNESDRLYNVRNAINHGEIDAENPTELVRVQSRLSRLWIIVWGMFGRIVPFPTPKDNWKQRA